MSESTKPDFTVDRLPNHPENQYREDVITAKSIFVTLYGRSVGERSLRHNYRIGCSLVGISIFLFLFFRVNMQVNLPYSFFFAYSKLIFR